MSPVKQKKDEAPYYRHAIAQYPPLTTAQELELFSVYRKYRTAKKLDVIVRQYLHWAAEIACRYAGPRLKKAEAISAANLGLMQAITTYDPARGQRFVTHSFFAIRRHVLQALYQTYCIDPEPGITAAKYRFDRSEKTAADRAQYSEERRQVFDSLASANPPGDGELSDADSRESAERASWVEMLREALPALPAPLRQIMELRYFSAGGLATFNDIARKLALAPDRVRWLHADGLKRLRRSLKTRENEL